MSHVGKHRTPRALARPLGRTSVGAIAGLTVLGGILASNVQADPNDDALAKLNELSRQAEQTTEAMHSAQLDLTNKLEVQAAADSKHEADASAVDAAKAVGYVGAGTVEFIANQDGSFYFMEMNTRLQVEHPVTEMITGQDLVEWQLRVAAGQPLPLKQEQLEIRGHALEARIYAEDANKGFLPATGRLIHLAPPAESINVRVDTGVEEGDEITPFYDPMIAKLIVWDETRDGALARMRKALADYRVAGLTTNIDFLSRLVACPAFAKADLDTGLIERQKDFLFPAAQPVPRDALLVATVGELLWEQHAARQAAQHSGDPFSPWHARDGWRMNLSAARTISFMDGETLVEARVRGRFTMADARFRGGGGATAGSITAAEALAVFDVISISHFYHILRYTPAGTQRRREFFFCVPAGT